MARFPSTQESQHLSNEAVFAAYNRQPRKAHTLYARALQAEPDCVYLIVQYGLFLQECGELGRARRLYERAIELDPEYGPAYYGRGWLKGWCRDYEGELADARRGYRLDPVHGSMYLFRIGAALAGLGRYRDALDAYSRVIAAEPQDENALFSRATCYARMGRHSFALRDLDRALELRPGWEWALRQRAITHEHLGRLDDAYRDIREALARRLTRESCTSTMRILLKRALRRIRHTVC